MSAHHSKQEDFLFTMVTWLPVGKKPSKTGTKVDSGREDVPCSEEFSDDKFAGEKEWLLAASQWETGTIYFKPRLS